jgi:hypothetical protein
MAINFSTQLYPHTQNAFGRPVTFSGVASPSGGRGIYATEPIDITAEDGSIISDNRTILDIMEVEFTTLPLQGDTVDIPAYQDLPAIGQFKVIDSKNNGGGEITLTLRRVVPAKP